MKIYKIYDLGNGWYDFKDVPQKNYFKVHGRTCKSEEEALRYAKQLSGRDDLTFAVEAT